MSGAAFATGGAVLAPVTPMGGRRPVCASRQDAGAFGGVRLRGAGACEAPRTFAREGDA